MNKPVLDFDEFMRIPVRLASIARITLTDMPQGCANGPHSDAAPKTDAAKPPTSANIVVTGTHADGKETFSTTLSPQQVVSTVTPTPPAPEPEQEEEDDFDAPVALGIKCKRNGCKVVYESDEVNRMGDGPGATCTYHPKAVGTSAPAPRGIAYPNIGSSG